MRLTLGAAKRPINGIAGCVALPETLICCSYLPGRVSLYANRGFANMLHRYWVIAIALAGTLGAPDATAQYGGRKADLPDRIVRCESGDGREHRCAVDTRGGVRLVRQLSRSACIEGQSWGIERNGIWVTQGCRAEFVAGRGGSEFGDLVGRSRVVRCESGSGRSNLCAMDTRRGVQLVRQLSRSSCIREQSWGWNDHGVWVSGGCRAEFRARGDGRGGDSIPAPARGGLSVRCESKEGRLQHCPIETRGGVRLLRQLSRTPCVEERNWGHDRRGIWVDGGCRADFEVENSSGLHGGN